MDCGTDLTAILWKTLQSTQIQRQLDQSHNLYDKPVEKLSPTKNTAHHYYLNNHRFRITNIDNDLRKIHKKKKNINSKKNNNVSDNLYLPTIRRLYNMIYECIISQKGSKDEIKQMIIKELLQDNKSSVEREYHQSYSDLMNLGNYMDIRKSKSAVFYIMSDFQIRRGFIYQHPIYSKIQGWLYDAVQLSITENLYLVYSTDIRGVNEWMNQLCSLINIHNLISTKLEEGGLNYTAILVHLAGIFSTRPLDSINRQGMSFPNNIIQKSTFENVRKLLSAANLTGTDNLSSFVSSTIACIPHKTGTNSFDVIISSQ